MIGAGCVGAECVLERVGDCAGGGQAPPAVGPRNAVCVVGTCSNGGRSGTARGAAAAARSSAGLASPPMAAACRLTEVLAVGVDVDKGSLEVWKDG